MDIGIEFIKIGAIVIISMIVAKFLHNNLNNNQQATLITNTNNNTRSKTKLPHVVYKNAISQEKKSISIYNDWIRQHLPNYVPEDIIDKRLPKDVSPYGDYVIGLQYYVDADPGRVPQRLEYEANSEQDLKNRIFMDISKWISFDVELLNREKEEIKWRYVDKQINSKWMYKENKNYLYNAIFDSRKYWMEYHLNLLKPVITSEKLNVTINEYESLLNNKFKIQHWKFDKEKFEFVEVSDSKEVSFPTDDEIVRD